jgi:hypothetical protein
MTSSRALAAGVKAPKVPAVVQGVLLALRQFGYCAKLMGRPAHMFVRGLRALDADGALCVVRVSDVVDFVKTMPTYLDDTATRDPNRVLLFDRVF